MTRPAGFMLPDTIKSHADRAYMETLGRYRVVLWSTQDFYDEFVHVWSVKLVSAQEAMAQFRKENPDYDPNEDEGDEIGALLSEYHFPYFPDIVPVRNGGMMWPPCKAGLDSSDDDE
ncbi:hypothetical protein M885DRAFT_499914 [Pelagophyceae sp. CCMP2097]|nr:hypothetical protein M885DRAFT_499914 [Pelagophyceae sp. CCMP2097]